MAPKSTPPPLHTFRGTPSTCEPCGKTFRGVAPFDAHRVGPIGYCSAHDPADVGKGHPENVETLTCKWHMSSRRRCLTDEELRKAGYETDERGAWTRKPRPGE